jgi:hypothetical protein
MAKGDVKIPAAVKKDKRLSWPTRAVAAVLGEAAGIGTSSDLEFAELRRAAGVDDAELFAAFEELCGATYMQTTGDSVSPEVAGSLSVELVLRVTFSEEAENLFNQKADDGFQAIPRTREMAGYQSIESGGTVYRVEVKAVHESEDSDGVLWYRLDITAQDLGRLEPAIAKVEDQRFPNRDEAWEFWDQWCDPYLTGEGAAVLGLDEPTISGEPDPGTESEEEDEGDGDGDGIDDHQEFSVQLEDGEHVKVQIRPEGRGWFGVQFFGPVNEAGHYVRKTRRGEFAEDPEGWALRHAQELRFAYLKTQGGS